ncbi:MAG: hypothetical protein GKR89_03990 [Candidatus Latescibacteria bacterium]|nr:hypothetical protein [Candidatus Latescibacterota bacterium]
MNPEIPVYDIALPEYTVSSKPDYQAVGDQIDQKIQAIFAHRPIIERALTVADRPGKSLDESVQIILELGHDRYHPQRKGVGYPGHTQEALHTEACCGFAIRRISRVPCWDSSRSCAKSPPRSLVWDGTDRDNPVVSVSIL